MGTPAGRMRLHQARVAAAFAAIPVIGYLHYLTGIGFEFHLFFLFAVIAAAWYGTFATGMAAALFATAAWFVTDWWLTGAVATGKLMFNEAMRLGVFVLAVLLTWRLKTALARESVLARADPLTGLPNRRAFFELGAAEIERARRYRRPISALFFDIDDFKRVNDRFGHEQGDALLRAVARALRAETRAADVCGRLGGDEFAMLLPETDAPAARAFAATLRERLLEAARQCGWPVTFSIGAATFRTPPADVGQLIAHADALMYTVKQRGKDSVVVAEV
jgi:diguanylate cyclase (GGDEF)-like protein